MDVKVKKMKDNAILPTYSTDGAGCFDLYACLGQEVKNTWLGNAVTIDTGLSFEIPDGYAMMIFSRSGHGFSAASARLANCVGIIDSDYRGEVKVKIVCDGGGELSIGHGDRIAQGMLVPVDTTNFILVDVLDPTERGDGGFGSTGK